MPWLEVPDWRAWEPYARPMSDTPDETPEPVVITGELRITLDDDDSFQPPSIDDVLAGNTDEPDDDVDDDELQAAIAEHPAGRFPTENVAERVDPPAASRLAPPDEVTHRPATADESDDERQRRIEKESMSRGERRRRGW
jgi:hypothetical protein